MRSNIQEQVENLNSEETEWQIDCSLCEKVILWFKEQKLKDVNFITLEIKDEVMRKKFLDNELSHVKRRWEITTIVVIIFVILSILMNHKDEKALIGFLLQTGDITIVLITMSLLGKKFKSVHHYSIYMIIFVRAISSLAQVQLKIKEIEPFNELFDYYAWTSSVILRIFVPSSMLFLTQWKHFFYFALPFSLVMQSVLLSYSEQVYGGAVNCDSMMENFTTSATILKDFTLILVIALGIFSHCKALVSRFIMFEKSKIQQSQLTQVFHEQSDGLIVLKQKISDPVR